MPSEVSGGKEVGKIVVSHCGGNVRWLLESGAGVGEGWNDAWIRDQKLGSH